MTDPQPLRLLERDVAADWIDFNGHMTESRYLYAVTLASEAFLIEIGADAAYIESGCSYYTAETHLMHFAEAKQGQKITVDMQVVSHDDKRIHVFFWIRLKDNDRLLATAEQMFLHVDMKAARACAAREDVLAKLKTAAARHQSLPVPKFAGRHVGQRKQT